MRSAAPYWQSVCLPRCLLLPRVRRLALLLFLSIWVVLIWIFIQAASKSSDAPKESPDLQIRNGGAPRRQDDPGKFPEKNLLLRRLQPGSSAAVSIQSQSKGDHPAVPSEDRFPETDLTLNTESPDVSVHEDVHIFYYPWYRSKLHDGEWSHWNHELLPHWNAKEEEKWPKGSHSPPADIAASFYPSLGPYSSGDAKVVTQHMQDISSAGAGVVVMSWYPPDDHDENGKPIESLTALILNSAQQFGLKVALHIEPYKSRNAESLKENVEYIITSYGSHPAFYKRAHKGRSLPVFYVYDSYLTPKEDWQELLTPSGRNTVRNTPLDGVFLGLLVEQKHPEELREAGFDGFYTYFAVKEFTFGSNWDHWKSLSNYAKRNHLLFVPSVGPGYDDTRVRPWNGQNSRSREHGQYYSRAFRAAILAQTDAISITSFNEWHEGTQIEPAVPKRTPGAVYSDYEPEGSRFYLRLTRMHVQNFARGKSKRIS